MKDIDLSPAAEEGNLNETPPIFNFWRVVPDSFLLLARPLPPSVDATPPDRVRQRRTGQTAGIVGCMAPRARSIESVGIANRVCCVCIRPQRRRRRRRREGRERAATPRQAADRASMRGSGSRTSNATKSLWKISALAGVTSQPCSALCFCGRAVD